MLKFLCVWMLLSVGLGGCCQSHKANLALPPSFNRRLNGPGNGTPPGVVCPEVAAGSCLFFSEACVHATHGFLDPRHKRRVLLYKYAQKHVAQGQDAGSGSADGASSVAVFAFAGRQGRHLPPTRQSALTSIQTGAAFLSVNQFSIPLYTIAVGIVTRATVHFVDRGVIDREL